MIDGVMELAKEGVYVSVRDGRKNAQRWRESKEGDEDGEA